MSKDWLKRLENELEERFAEFLRKNPYQEVLLREDEDTYKCLKNRKLSILYQASKARKKLINTYKNIKGS